MNASRKIILPDDIPDDDLREVFLCTASGPGGQHVNRTASTVRLFFDVNTSLLLDPASKQRLKKQHADENGNISVTCRETRSQIRNRELAKETLAQWITEALVQPRARKKTKPTKASRQRRLKSKQHRSEIKAGRSEKFDF